MYKMNKVKQHKKVFLSSFNKFDFLANNYLVIWLRITWFGFNPFMPVDTWTRVVWTYDAFVNNLLIRQGLTKYLKETC